MFFHLDVSGLGIFFRLRPRRRGERVLSQLGVQFLPATARGTLVQALGMNAEREEFVPTPTQVWQETIVVQIPTQK